MISLMSVSGSPVILSSFGAIWRLSILRELIILCSFLSWRVLRVISIMRVRGLLSVLAFAQLIQSTDYGGSSMADVQFVHLMMCLGFGLGCIFWSLVWFFIAGGHK